MKTFFGHWVRFFLTGVAAMLPLIVTVFVVTWVVRLADAYIGPSSSFGVFILTITGESKKYVGYVGGYLVVILLATVLGFLVTRATAARVQRAIDRMFARIPLIGKIYSAVGQVVDLFGKKEDTGLERFGGVGCVRIGNVKLLGLLTSGERYILGNGEEYLLLFVPNSPFPATGFTVLVPAKDFECLDIPVEDMVKLLMSLGLLGSQVLKKPANLIPIWKTKNDCEAP